MCHSWPKNGTAKFGFVFQIRQNVAMLLDFRLEVSTLFFRNNSEGAVRHFQIGSKIDGVWAPLLNPDVTAISLIGTAMSIHDAFVVRLTPSVAAPAAGTQNPQAQGVFISAQSLVSFPIASMVATLITKLAETLFKVNHNYCALVASLVVGATVFVFNVTDPEAKPQGLAAWVKASAIGVLNALLLACSVLGLGVVTSSSAGNSGQS